MTRHLVRILAIASLSIAVPAIAGYRRGDTARTKASVLRADSLLSAQVRRDGPAVFLARLTPDAAVLFTGQPIYRGPRGARAAFMSRYARPASYTWQPAAAIASTDGRLACTVGFSRFLPGGTPTDSVRRGLYITCWTRAGSGEWRIVGHQRNDSPRVDSKFLEQPNIAHVPHSPNVQTATRDALREAQDTDSLFAVMAELPEGPGVAFARNAANDAVLIGAPGFPHGREQILAAFKDFPPHRVLRWQPSREFGAGTGGLAFTVGNSVTTSRDGSTDKDYRGKFLTVWRREPDGTWKYVYDLGSPRP